MDSLNLLNGKGDSIYACAAWKKYLNGIINQLKVS